MVDKIHKIFKNRNIILGASIILGIAAIIFMYSEVNIKEVINTFKNTTLLLIFLYIVVQMAIISVVTWRWKIVLQSQGITHIPMSRLTKYVLVGIGVGFLTPSGKLGSEPVRAGLVSAQENIKFEKAMSSVVIDRALDVSASVAFFVIGLIIMLFVFIISPAFADVLLVVSVILLLAIIIFNYRMLNGKKVFHHVFRFLRLHKFKKFQKFEKKLVRVENLIIKFYHEDTKYFYQAMLICLLSWVLMFVEYKIAGLMVGQNLTPVQSFIVFSFIGMAYIMPVPMALGTLEASQISAFSIMGVSAAAGLAVSFLVRLKDLITSLAGIVILGMYGVSVKKTVKETDYLDTNIEQTEKNKLQKKQNTKPVNKKQKIQTKNKP